MGQERTLHDARQRLAQASTAGVPEHELRAILDGIQRASQPRNRSSRFVSMAALCNAPPAENWLIEGYLTLDSLNVLFGDPDQARVTLVEWQDAMRVICEDKGSRNRIRRTLLNGGHVRIDGDFIHPVR